MRQREKSKMTPWFSVYQTGWQWVLMRAGEEDGEGRDATGLGSSNHGCCFGCASFSLAIVFRDCCESTV